MSLCCVYCGRKARFMYKGTSLCKEHLSKELRIQKEGSQNSEIIVIDAPAVPE